MVQFGGGHAAWDADEGAGWDETAPAMAAGVTDLAWKIEDVLARMDPDRKVVESAV